MQFCEVILNSERVYRRKKRVHYFLSVCVAIGVKKHLHRYFMDDRIDLLNHKKHVKKLLKKNICNFLCLVFFDTVLQNVEYLFKRF